MASNSGMLFLNKVIQTEDFGAFKKHGINADTFLSKAEQRTYEYIENYHAEYGDVPSYANVADNVEDFVYVPEITDKFEALSKGVKERKMAAEFNRLFSDKFPEIQTEHKGNTSNIISQLTEELESIRMKYTNTCTVGKSAKDTKSYLEEYRKRQSGESYSVWKSFMPYLNDQLGGYSSGNFYVLFAKSGRGKSVFAIREALEFAMQGAKVLYWGLEMDYYSIMTRLYSMLSAKLGKTVMTIEGTRMEAGFSTRDLRQGTLAEDFEASFEQMLEEINEHIPGEIIIKSIDDPSFINRSADQVEADVRATEAEVVVIDPLYLMSMEANQSKTAGGDAAATSKKIRLLAGLLDVPIIGVTQSEEGDEKEGEGVRELKVPDRKAVKKSKAFLEDSSAVIGIDSDYTQGRAVAGIQKGREGGEGSKAELTYIPSHGVVEELSIDGDMFDF